MKVSEVHRHKKVMNTAPRLSGPKNSSYVEKMLPGTSINTTNDALPASLTRYWLAEPEYPLELGATSLGAPPSE